MNYEINYAMALETPPQYWEEEQKKNDVTFTVKFNGRVIGVFKDARKALECGRSYAYKQSRKSFKYIPVWFHYWDVDSVHISVNEEVIKK